MQKLLILQLHLSVTTIEGDMKSHKDYFMNIWEITVQNIYTVTMEN